MVKTQDRLTVVVAGAGYGGLAAARLLGRRRRGLRVILIDRHDYHLLQFQLHEAAVNKIDVDALALPLNGLLPRSVDFVQACITGFDFERRSVQTDQGDFNYDRLIIGLGSQPATYNIDGLHEHALMLKSARDAQRIRGHLEVVLSALRLQDRATPYPIVIGGAGITGVELAAELSEALTHLCREYDLARGAIKVFPSKARHTILPGFDRKTVREANKALKRLGVEVHTGVAIERVETDRVSVRSIRSETTETIETQTLIWTGGVQANALVSNSGLRLGERGAALVDEFLRSVDYPEVSIVGDSAVVRDPRDGRIAIPCGQLAVKQGQYAARQVLADLDDAVHPPYIPVMEGLLISLGSYAGVGTVGPVWVRRLIARLAKIGAETRYLFNIGGIRLVMSRWLWLRHEWVAIVRRLRSGLGYRRTIRTSRGAVK